MAGSAKDNSEHIEQRAYVPLVGILIMISQIDFSKSRIFSNRRYSGLILIFIFLSLSIKTISRSKVYANPFIMAQTAIKESPHQTYFYIVLGGIYAENDMSQEALKWYDKYIEKFPNKAIPYINKAVVYSHIKKFDKAIENYNKAIELEPNTSSLYLDRGHVYFELKMYDSVLTDLTRAKKLGEKINEKFERQIEDQIMAENEIKIYSNNISKDTATSFSYNRRGIAFYKKGDYTNAINDFSISNKLNPLDPISLIKRGWIYEFQGKFDSAYYDYNKLAGMGYSIGKEALENLKGKINTSKNSNSSKK